MATPLAVDAADQHRDTDEQGNPRVVWSSHREQLQGAVRDAHAVVDALRGAAEGRAVELPYERLPACLRAGGWADLGRATPEQEAEEQRVNRARAELQDAEAFAAGSQRALLAAIAAERREPGVPQRRREVQEAQARADQAAVECEAARARCSGIAAGHR